MIVGVAATQKTEIKKSTIIWVYLKMVHRHSDDAPFSDRLSWYCQEHCMEITEVERKIPHFLRLKIQSAGRVARVVAVQGCYGPLFQKHVDEEDHKVVEVQVLVLSFENTRYYSIL